MRRLRLAQLFLEECAGALVDVISPPRILATRSSSGEEKLILGMGIFSFSASSRTASGKVMFSIFCTNAKTSPDAPQPKQWKNCREACTDIEGVFS